MKILQVDLPSGTILAEGELTSLALDAAGKYLVHVPEDQTARAVYAGEVLPDTPAVRDALAAAHEKLRSLRQQMRATSQSLAFLRVTELLHD